jgi:hypothetical protein
MSYHPSAEYYETEILIDGEWSHGLEVLAVRRDIAAKEALKEAVEEDNEMAYSTLQVRVRLPGQEWGIPYKLRASVVVRVEEDNSTVGHHGRIMKNYYVEGAGWFVVTTPNKKRAYSVGVAEYGRGGVRCVREATKDEVANFIAQKSKEAMRE